MKTIKRLQKAFEYSSTSRSALARVKLGLLGYFSPLERHEPGFQWLARWFPFVTVQPSRLQGLRLAISPNDWSETIVFEELFLKAGYDLDLVKFQPTDIVDCGGHIGMFSLLANAKFPDAPCYIYEPNPQNFKRIQANKKINGLAWTCLAGAVTVEDGEADLDIVNSHGSSISEKLGTISNTVHVKTFGLAGAIKALAAKRLLLKIDIEGEELKIWPSLIPELPAICAIFFETHHGVTGWSTAKNLLTERGFAVTELNRRGDYYDGFAERVKVPASTIGKATKSSRPKVRATV